MQKYIVEWKERRKKQHTEHWETCLQNNCISDYAHQNFLLRRKTPEKMKNKKK